MCADETSEALLAAVRRQAEEERQEILAQAQREAQAIEAQADAQIERLKAEALNEANKAILIETDRLLGQARRDKSYALLCAKRRLLLQAFEQAGREIEALPHSDDYANILQTLMAEAVAAAGDNACLIVAKSEKALGKAAAAKLDVACSVKPSDHPPGTVIAASADGHRRIDNSLHRRLSKTEALRKHEIATLLFGSRDGQSNAQ